MPESDCAFTIHWLSVPFCVNNQDSSGVLGK